MTETTRYGAWDCATPGCNEVHISTKHRICPNCGDPRSEVLTPQERSYFDPHGEIVNGEELVLAKAGPDWNCGNCRHDNRFGDDLCYNCGEPRGADDAFNETASYDDGVGFNAVKDDGRRPDGLSYEELAGAESGDLDQVRRELADEPIPSEHFDIHGPAPQKAGPSRWDFENEEPRSRVQDTVQPDPLTIEDFRRKAKDFWWHYKAGIMAALGAVFIFFVGWLVYATFFKTHDVPLVVDNLEWERQVEVQQYKTVIEEAWSIPARGRYVSDRQAVHHYDRVFSHYEQKSRQVPYQVPDTETYTYDCGTSSNGNGTFTTRTCTGTRSTTRTEYRTEYYQEPVYDQVPVYRTKYTYEIDRWKSHNWVRTSDATRSDSYQQPYWANPEVSFTGGSPQIGDTRVSGNRRDTYTIYVSSVDESLGLSYEEELSFDRWTTLGVGDEVIGKVNSQDQLRRVVLLSEVPAETG